MFTLYGEDTHFTAQVAELERSPVTGGLTERPLRNRQDVAVLLTTAAGVEITAATLALTESTTGGTFFGTWQGADLLDALDAVASGATIGRRVRVGDDLSPIEWGTWVPTRTV